jgi:hypothetical protein
MSSPPSDASQSREPGTSRSPPPPPPPPLDVRWLHAGAQYLDLPTNPVTSLNTTYKAFSVTESNRLEEAWWCLTDDERREYAPKGGKGASNGKATSRPSSVDSTNGNTTPLKAEEKDEQGNLVINSGAEASRLGKHRGDKEDGPKHGVGQAMMEKTATEGVGVGASVMEKTGSQQEDPVDHIVRMVDPAGKGKGMILEDLETVRGVPVSQVSRMSFLGQCSCSRFFATLVLTPTPNSRPAGRPLRGVSFHHVTRTRLLGSHRPSSPGHPSDVVHRRRGPSLRVGIGRGIGERIPVGPSVVGGCGAVARKVTTDITAPQRNQAIPPIIP